MNQATSGAGDKTRPGEGQKPRYLHCKLETYARKFILFKYLQLAYTAMLPGMLLFT